MKDKSAFPVAIGPTDGIREGMTLREYYAGQALAGLCADGLPSEFPYCDVASDCVRAADALIKELEK